MTNKFIEYTVPEDHTGRNFVKIKILNEDFIGPLNKIEYDTEELYNYLAEEIRKEIDNEILSSIVGLVNNNRV